MPFSSREIAGWMLQDNGRYRCAACGLVVRIDDSDPLPIRHHCRLRQAQPSGGGVTVANAATKRNTPRGLVRRAMNFALAAFGHLLRGAPTCPQVEIDSRLSICRACSLFNGSICTHEDCGCHVTRQRRFLNKLAWAD